MLLQLSKYLRRKFLWLLYITKKFLKKIKHCYFTSLKVHNDGYGKFSKYITGVGNSLVIKKDTFFDKTFFRIIGDNNTIIFEKGCHVGHDCSFWISGNNINIRIGGGTSFTGTCHVNAEEDGMNITIGDDCMFSNHITIRTGDSHPIFSQTSGERVNFPKDVVIGNHVWVAPHSEIMKGAVVEDGVIIGSHTMVSKHIPQNVLVVGRPARIVKESVYWTREGITDYHKEKD